MGDSQFTKLIVMLSLLIGLVVLNSALVSTVPYSEKDIQTTIVDTQDNSGVVDRYKSLRMTRQSGQTDVSSIGDTMSYRIVVQLASIVLSETNGLNCSDGLPQEGVVVQLEYRTLNESNFSPSSPWIHLESLESDSQDRLQQFNISVSVPGNVSMVQFRLRQHDHAGGECGCWIVVQFDIFGESGLLNDIRWCEIEGSVSSTESQCIQNSQTNITFCGGSASGIRGVETNAISLHMAENLDSRQCTCVDELNDTMSISFTQCNTSQPHINVTFQLYNPTTPGSCDASDNFDEGVEFSYRIENAASRDWIPIIYFAPNDKPANRLSQNVSLRVGTRNQENLTVRNYRVPYQFVESGTNLTVQRTICGDEYIRLGVLEFRWLQTVWQINQQLGIGRDVWSFNGVNISFYDGARTHDLLNEQFSDARVKNATRNSNLTPNPAQPCDAVSPTTSADDGIVFGLETPTFTGANSRLFTISVNLSVEVTPQTPTTSEVPTTAETPSTVTPSRGPKCTAPVCQAEDTTYKRNDGADIVLHWPQANFGTNSSLPYSCPCGNTTVIFNAYRYCGGEQCNGTRWENVRIQPCAFGVAAQELCQLMSGNVSVEETIDQLQEITENQTNIAAQEFTITSQILGQLSDIISIQQNITVDVIDSFLSVVDNILEVDQEQIRRSQEISNATTRVLNAISTVTDSIPIPENMTEVSIARNLLAVSVSEVEVSEFDGQTFSVALRNITQDSRIALSYENQSMSTASIELPRDLFMHISANNTQSSRTLRISHVVYLDDSLFKRTEDRDSLVGSVIISASVSTNVTVKDLDTPVITTFVRTSNTREYSNATNESCVFWDFEANDGFGDWSSAGCWLVNDNGMEATCACDHLTHFALLLDPKPNPDVTLPPAAGKTLHALSYIGAIVSIIFLTLTIATFLSSKKLRSLLHGKLLINMCFGLLGIYVMFIVAYHSTETIDVICAIAGGLLHYFILATFAIMVAEAITLFIKLVLVLGWYSVPRYYALKTALISWIVPVFIVVACVSPNYTKYVGEQLCRPDGLPFYIGLLAPLGLMYIFNWIVFLAIFVSLLKRSCQKKEIKLEDDKVNTTRAVFKRHFIIAVCLSLMFGLGWGLGIPATSAITNLPFRIILQTFFVLFVGIQGPLIFVMQCVRSVEARAVWKRWLKFLSCGKFDIKSTEPTSTFNHVLKDKTATVESGVSVSDTLDTKIAHSTEKLSDCQDTHQTE